MAPTEKCLARDQQLNNEVCFSLNFHTDATLGMQIVTYERV